MTKLFVEEKIVSYMKRKMINKLLEKEYEKVVSRAVELKIIKREEWDNRFKNYRDEFGHSFVHYLECIMSKINFFLTINPIMLKNKKELEERFGVKILSPEEAIKEIGKKK